MHTISIAFLSRSTVHIGVRGKITMIQTQARPEPMIIHGFQVHPYGPVSSEFRRALRTLARRGFCDPTCAIVKTRAGNFSGITHAGGRYLVEHNPCAPAVLAMMKEQGITPPAFPFLVAPGPKILFHELGHHVDRRWRPPDRVLP